MLEHLSVYIHILNIFDNIFHLDVHYVCMLVQRFEPQGRRFTNFSYYYYLFGICIFTHVLTLSNTKLLSKIWIIVVSSLQLQTGRCELLWWLQFTVMRKVRHDTSTVMLKVRYGTSTVYSYAESEA